MAVILHRDGDRAAPNNATCSICEGHLLAPYLRWDVLKPGLPDIFMCCECCVGIGEGFMADIIQVRAIADFQYIYGRSFTFKRVSVSSIEADLERQKQNYEEIMRIKPAIVIKKDM